VPVAVCFGILMVILPSAQWSHLPWLQLMAEAWPKGRCFFEGFFLWEFNNKIATTSDFFAFVTEDVICVHQQVACCFLSWIGYWGQEDYLCGLQHLCIKILRKIKTCGTVHIFYQIQYAT
jgi:hypothetical protein